MQGPPPSALVERVEEIIDNQEIDHVIFVMTLILGKIITRCFPPENHEIVMLHCFDAIEQAMKAATEEERPARSRPS